MSDPIDVPPELQHLIEKRERDEDRRKSDADVAKQQDSGAPESVAERRNDDDRRDSGRRQEDR